MKTKIITEVYEELHANRGRFLSTSICWFIQSLIIICFSFLYPSLPLHPFPAHPHLSSYSSLLHFTLVMLFFSSLILQNFPHHRSISSTSSSPWASSHKYEPLGNLWKTELIAILIASQGHKNGCLISSSQRSPKYSWIFRLSINQHLVNRAAKRLLGNQQPGWLIVWFYRHYGIITLLWGLLLFLVLDLSVMGYLCKCVFF